MRRYDGSWLDSVIGISIAIPSYDISRVYVFTHMTYDMVGRVLSVVFHILLGAFRAVTNPVAIDFVSRLSDTLRGLSLSITTAYGQICGHLLSRPPLFVLGLVKSLLLSQTRLFLTSVRAMPGQRTL